jgi:hypothetical protein
MAWNRFVGSAILALRLDEPPVGAILADQRFKVGQFFFAVTARTDVRIDRH